MGSAYIIWGPCISISILYVLVLCPFAIVGHNLPLHRNMSLKYLPYNFMGFAGSCRVTILVANIENPQTIHFYLFLDPLQFNYYSQPTLLE